MLKINYFTEGGEEQVILFDEFGKGSYDWAFTTNGDPVYSGTGEADEAWLQDLYESAAEATAEDIESIESVGLQEWAKERIE